MNRVCIIGNSHLGAFRLALDAGEIEGISDRYAFDTFGSIRASLTQTRISGGKLVPLRKNVAENFERTSGGQKEIRLGTYQAFILAVRNSPFWIRPYLFDTELGPVSDTMVEAIHREFLDDWSIELATRIAEAAPKAQVYFLGRPLNSDKDFLAKRLQPQLDGPGAMAASVIKDTLLHRINHAVRNSDLPPNLSLVRPPDHMLDPHRLFTLSRYSRGADKAQTGLKQVFKKDDTQHMNGDYGREILQHLLAGQ